MKALLAHAVFARRNVQQRSAPNQALGLPAKRRKGIDQYKEIEWDEAIDLIQEKIQYALDNGGSNTMPYQGGSQPWLRL